MTYARTIHAPAVARDRHGLDAFAGGLRGSTFGPGDAAYAEACHIWNGMIERRPALVVRPRSATDVAACIAFARGNGLPLSVRGGGHNIAGTALCEGGVMIDFSTHKDVEVDATTGRVRVQPGATWADVDRATQPFGLVVPGGIISATGVAGFTLGGGFGWVSRRHGFAADNLRAVKIVTADGQVRRASDDQHADRREVIHDRAEPDLEDLGQRDGGAVEHDTAEEGGDPDHDEDPKLRVGVDRDLGLGIAAGGRARGHSGADVARERQSGQNRDQAWQDERRPPALELGDHPRHQAGRGHSEIAEHAIDAERSPGLTGILHHQGRTRRGDRSTRTGQADRDRGSGRAVPERAR